MQDPDQAVAELAQRGVVPGAAGPELVVVGPCAGWGVQRAEPLWCRASARRWLRTNRASTTVLLARGAGDRGATGVVLPGAGTLVAVGVVAELAEYPGAEDLTEAGLAPVDLRVRVPAKTRLDLPLQHGDLGCSSW